MAGECKTSEASPGQEHNEHFSKSRTWCKTIVTTSFYIRTCNSFAPSPQNMV